MVFFIILPIDVNREKPIKINGEDAGSPENPKMLKKFMYCTSITTIILVIIYLLYWYNKYYFRNNLSVDEIRIFKFKNYN